MITKTTLAIVLICKFAQPPEKIFAQPPELPGIPKKIISKK